MYKTNDLIKNSAFLSFLTLGSFFGIYFFFKKETYFQAFIVWISFFLTPLYAFFVTYQTYNYSKKKASVSLLDAFSFPFFTLILTGFFSLLMLFLFFNYLVDEKAIFFIKKNILERWFEANKQQMISTFGESAYNMRVSAIHQANLFGLWTFLVSLFFCIIYYFLLSILLGFFFRKN